MNKFKRIFSLSFKHLLNSPSVYVFFFICLLVNLLMAIIIPSVIGHDNRDHWRFDDQSSITVFTVITVYASMIGESNANPEERIFILTRPVKRSTYFWSKICCTLIVTTTLFLCIFIIWLISYLAIAKSEFVGTAGYKYFPQAMLAVFILASMGAFVGTSLRYYLRNRVTSLILMFSVLLVFLLFSIVYKTSKGEPDKTYYLIMYTVLPLVVFIPITSILTRVGFALNKRDDIKI
ncbi:MAG: hypothetical protein LBJ97_03265 [Mycoplasmataceae bacterium]|nr:hypothetical protein [Mycoplasmataceae bacterium]